MCIIDGVFYNGEVVGPLLFLMQAGMEYGAYLHVIMSKVWKACSLT